jgi:hypothetical protein
MRTSPTSSSRPVVALSTLAIAAPLSFLLVGFAGCGGRVAGNDAQDTGGTTTPVGPDTSPSYPDARPTPVYPDVRPPSLDTSPPPPLSCAADLPSDFVCSTPKITAGGTVCSEAMIQEFQTACFGGSGAECSAWTKKYADCNKCVFRFLSPSGWLEEGYCMQALAPTSSCGKLFGCNIDCYEAVCEACDHTMGSGRTPSGSEYQDCVADAQYAGSASKSMGRCYNIVGKDLKAAACTTTDPMVGCLDVVQFFRGACRDNADWSNMKSATPK